MRTRSHLHGLRAILMHLNLNIMAAPRRTFAKPFTKLVSVFTKMRLARSNPILPITKGAHFFTKPLLFGLGTSKALPRVAGGQVGRGGRSGACRQ